ncbi:MAG TPA: hypothetical protein DCS93_25190 [Microscillaceae bacterium]|nr:hypothetical protein [Microscillaceae bacterium]
MKETEGNEHIDFFSQDTILDYIDGRLSTQDNTLFEQQMQEDEMLQLAVEGIKGFYTEEQKDRPYLETLMTQSEENLKQALVEVENAPKVVALNTKRRNRKIIGISIAACVALLMVFSLPGLLDNKDAKPTKNEIAVTTTNPEEVKPKTPEPKVADTKEQGEGAAQTGPKRDDVTTSGNPDMFNRTDAIAFEEKKTAGSGPEKKNTDGGVTEIENEEVEDDMSVPVNQGFIPQPKKTKAETKDASHHLPKKPGNVRESTLESEKVLKDFSAKTKEEKGIARKSKKRAKAKGRPRRRTAPKENISNSPNSIYFSSDKKDEGRKIAYRTPGKLYLWLYADEQNMEYFRVQNLGREIADNTGLELVVAKANTQVFLNQKWKKHLKRQNFEANDVVWIYYLGKNTPTSYLSKYSKKSAAKRPGAQLSSVVNDLSRRLEKSKVALKIVTIDQGNQSQPALDDFNGRQTNKSNVTPYTQQGISQVGKSLPKKNEVYKKLFLGSSGSITILNSKPGGNVYQGIFTNNLVQSLQGAYQNNDPTVDWNKILKKTTNLTQQRSQQLGKPQEIQQRKMKVKKSY